MTKIYTSTVGFCDQFVTINSHGSEASALTNFLCCDLQKGSHLQSQTTYDITIDAKNETFSLRQREKQIYSGDQLYDLAYALINEIVYQCIVDNNFGQAIHAAAIATPLGGVLIPGKSGSGKSTFTTWLTSCGCNYLTDELVVLSGEPVRIHPFTRPLSIKNGSLPTLSSFVEFNQPEIILGPNGAMLPHRMVNEKFTPTPPPLSLVIFPKFTKNATNELTQLSGALGCAQLLECYVNARNFQAHGISELAELARTTPMYQLTYGSFDRLYELLAKSFPALF